VPTKAELEALTVPELRGLAADWQVETPVPLSRMRKPELVDVLAELAPFVTPEQEAVEAYYFLAANGGFDDGETVTFTGPTLTFELPADGEAAAIVRDGVPVPFRQHERTLSRTEGHFGRGRWTVHYRPT
jgi:hypothetical protein